MIPALMKNYLFNKMYYLGEKNGIFRRYVELYYFIKKSNIINYTSLSSDSIIVNFYNNYVKDT